MSALAAVAGRLRCPNCGAPLVHELRALGCANGHRFDVARQGYASLGAGVGDTAEMIAAREAFLGAGHFAPIAAALPRVDGLVVELGAGTAYYLSHVLGDGVGVALDTSKPALRRAARAHPRIAAVGADIWREIPLQDGVADLVLDVFAPRNGAEIARVLKPGGAAVVVTPRPNHLAELRDLLIGVDPAKDERLRASLAPLEATEHRELEFVMALSAEDVRQLVAMGPSAHHVQGFAPEAAQVTASVAIDTFRPRSN